MSYLEFIHPCKTTTGVIAPEEDWSRWFCKAKCPHGPHSPGQGLHTDSYWRGVKGSLVLMTNKHDKNEHKSGVDMSILGIFTVVAKKGDRFSLSPKNSEYRACFHQCIAMVLFYNDNFALDAPMSYVWRVTSIYQHLRKRNGSNFHTWFCKYQELAHLVICVCSPLHFLPHSPSSHAKDKLWNWCYKRCSCTWNPVLRITWGRRRN